MVEHMFAKGDSEVVECKAGRVRTFMVLAERQAFLNSDWFAHTSFSGHPLTPSKRNIGLSHSTFFHDTAVEIASKTSFPRSSWISMM